MGRVRNCADTHLGQIVCDKDGVVDWSPFSQYTRVDWLKGLGYYVEVLWVFRKRFLGKRLALFKSGQWHFHEDNTFEEFFGSRTPQ